MANTRLYQKPKYYKIPGLPGALVWNPNFTGPTYEEVIMSIDIRNEGIPNLMQYEYLKEVVKNYKQKFAKSFYVKLSKMGRKIDESFVDACKVREKDLVKVMEEIITTDNFSDVFIVTQTKSKPNEKPRVKHLDLLEDVKYCPKDFHLYRQNEDEEIIDVFHNQSQPNCYGSLFVAMFVVASACRAERRDGDPDVYSGLRQLALSIIEIARLYNETNPDEKAWRKQEDNTYKLLTTEIELIPKEEFDKIQAVFIETLSDIKEGKLPYVQDMARAIRATARYCASPFNDEDYYYSSKSDPARIRGFRYKQSLIKSMVETDPLRGCPFDDAVGYHSHYNTVEPEGYSAPWIQTIHIPNPGKYKTRAIHLALSPIQDRCCYIHNRLARVLDSIPSDCTKGQERGQLFAITVTDANYREEHGMNSVLAYDWSNATDKMAQPFQEECLRLVFPEEVVQFWHTVSSCEKVFRFKDGSSKRYIQVTGQPQGLLGSFDAFAFAHHVIMLMTMNLSDRKGQKPTDFYRVLGDDSIISSISYDPANRVGDAYCAICAWANMEINRSKSTEITHEDKVALVDFAKVTVLDGEYFSPIPSRLANRIGSPKGDYYALSGALWLSKHGSNQNVWIRQLIDYYYQGEEENRLAHLLVESGILPSFRQVGFQKDEIFDSEEGLKLAVVYCYSAIKSSMLSGMLGDVDKENLSEVNEKEQEDALLSILPEDLHEVWDKIEDIDHKINIAIENNLTKETVIREMIQGNLDQAKVIAIALKFEDSEVEAMSTAVELMNVISTGVDMMLVRDSIINLTRNMPSFGRLRYRSWYKRSSLDTMVLRRTLKVYADMFNTHSENA